MRFTRYALYYVPPSDAAWAGFATRWLGWDMVAGEGVAHPTLTGLPLSPGEITQSPRKYGLHGTIKPPFRLADNMQQRDLETACEQLCLTLAPVALGPLRLTRLGRFLALCPVPNPRRSPALAALAETCLRGLDHFRAPLSDAELAARRARPLTKAQAENLTNWGYPHVLGEFRFHITLSGRLAKPDLVVVEKVLQSALVPLLPEEVILGDLALVGEGPEGRFHLIRRFELLGS